METETRLPPTHPAMERLVGRSPALCELRWLIPRLAAAGMPVLVAGESGTGKELVARALHEAGPRAPEPFVTENCAAIPESLFESLLFGHVRGAFTGAERDHAGLFRQASGGTLFLDEVTEMPLHLQAKLLRVLQTGLVRPLGGRHETAVDARVVAATNLDPAALVREGRLRNDLYYRLKGAIVELPPLRRRPEDIAPIASRHLQSLRRDGSVPLRLTDEALRLLLRHDWPGNVRELLNELERAAALASGECIEPEHLSAHLARSGAPGAAGPAAQAPFRERELIERALLACHGAVARAAREIGWSRQKLYRRMERLGVRAGFGRAGGNQSPFSSTFQ